MTFPPIESLVPQRGAMRMVDRVVARDARSVTCELAVREGAAFVRDGRVPAAALVEPMAQAAAALIGLRARDAGGAPGVGHLLAAREVDLFADGARVGDVLRVRADCLDDDGSLARFRAEVTRDGALLATATLTVRRGGAA